MMLAGLIAIPILGGIIGWRAQAVHADAPRHIAIATLTIDLVVTIAIAFQAPDGAAWMASVNLPWIPHLGISFRLDMDGLSLVMILLTLVLGIIAILTSWAEIRERVDRKSVV